MGVHHSGFPPWFGMGDARLSGSPLVLSLHWCLLMKCMTSVFVVILYPQCAQTISWWLQVFLMVLPLVVLAFFVLGEVSCGV